MAVDALHAFDVMRRGKVGAVRGLPREEGRLRLRVAGGAEGVTLLLRGCKGEPAGSQDDPTAKATASTMTMVGSLRLRAVGPGLPGFGLEVVAGK